MVLDEINTYLELLANQTKDCHVYDAFQEKLVRSVEVRIYSLLKHWNDISFRRAILVIGLEEGLYYEPDAKLETKCFVVVCIRNSLLETLQSDIFADAGLPAPLSNEKLKSITAHAISYFQRFDFDKLSSRLVEEDIVDYFGAIADVHPVTWSVLCRLWTSANKVAYPAVVCEPYQIQELSAPTSNKNQNSAVSVVVMDGMDVMIDDALLRYLAMVQAGNMDSFYIGCFKMLTRNFEKLMRVFEFILTRGCAVVTNNYFLQNGYIEKREKPLRAAHNMAEAREQLLLKAKLGFSHKQVLKFMLENT